MPTRIRVGAVEYLNTKPLIERLTDFHPQIDLRLELPSVLADQLASDDLDVGLIPVIEFFRANRYRMVPNIAIGSRGPVLSVTLFSRQPWERIRKVAMDVGSRTSAALTQVLLRKRYGITPEIVPFPMHADPESLDTDAVLLIGDRAMRACLPGYAYAYDLGQEWTDWTGLPFVFAVWAVRDGVDLEGVDLALAEAKAYGLSQVGAIAQREAPGLGLDAGFCRRYLTNILHFDLGPREQAGLHHFYTLARDLELAPQGVTFESYHPTHLVESR
ncbi:menaquinone biosynthetic enzyme MqnA/MqnD family protein [Tuwongella immobilis]|uniref:Chorismate dehydratase n=1 Tax=Tuwongella immobilis TaxID=692036 RepID=A0A6C2YST0_9BACT|nr:menaquinone biosynthesis protein [Tuwongella immobilis]VIP04387.1 protein containing duf178 : Hypothetical conserved protein OS=uncultured planctomycete GN=HGMM_F11G08C18 PE=4 SV=1: VitK2_biosynth [Tuwongella immobilis]VTS06136.1 protein containing duf178 : Hypothetical conserved protein OS=uncultured planctomycete GN=HGMM_F11G08C18 PE=4 SV=1: VitK2_biosynth [Tuwongella immobilis]